MKVDGQCHCGQLTYEAEIDPDAVELCHCSDCQMLSGSAFSVVAPVAEGSFKLLGGTLTTYVKTAESGNRRQQGFCPDCGTRIYSRPESGTGYFGLRVGTTRQRAELIPRCQTWRRSAQSWVDTIGAIAPKFEEELPLT